MDRNGHIHFLHGEVRGEVGDLAHGVEDMELEGEEIWKAFSENPRCVFLIQFVSVVNDDKDTTFGLEADGLCEAIKPLRQSRKLWAQRKANHVPTLTACPHARGQFGKEAQERKIGSRSRLGVQFDSVALIPLLYSFLYAFSPSLEVFNNLFRVRGPCIKALWKASDDGMSCGYDKV
ncbi:MAG: hypothetical protein AAB318_05480, partial [Planctomycetota bacterium]